MTRYTVHVRRHGALMELLLLTLAAEGFVMAVIVAWVWK